MISWIKVNVVGRENSNKNIIVIDIKVDVFDFDMMLKWYYLCY